MRADGLRWQGIARVYRLKTAVRTVSSGNGDGFHWGDAALGVAAAIGVMLVAAAGAIGLRKQRPALHS